MIEFHPAANAFPIMDKKRYQELLEDIKKYGQREEITICEGMILDGRNRYNACLELDIKPETRQYDGDPWAYVWSLNGERRDLIAEQRYLICKYCEENSKAWQAKQDDIQKEANRKRSEAAKAQHKVSKPWKGEKMVVEQSVPPPDKEHKTRKAKAIASKTNAGAVARGDNLAKNRPDLAEKVRKGELSPAQAHKQMAYDKKMVELKAIKVIENNKRWSVNIGDITTYQTDLKFDFIITDPPYPKEYLHLYDVLGARSKEWLKPDGLLLAMCGQSYLDEIYNLLNQHLHYYWTCSYLTPGQPKPLRQKQVNSSWKPILVYAMNEKYKGKTFGDVFKSDENDKSLHKWGQSESGMLSIIEQVCNPGQTIFDPFMGAGTTGIAALKSNCFFYGIDINKENIEITKHRLTEVFI